MSKNAIVMTDGPVVAVLLLSAIMIAASASAAAPTTRPATTQAAGAEAATTERGEVQQFEADAITILPPLDAEAREPRTIAIDAETRVYLAGAAGGAAAGKRGDVKVGQRVMIQVIGGRAKRILIVPDRATGPQKKAADAEK